MNIYESDILKELFINPYTNQRNLSQDSNYSLGVVNKSIKSLIQHGYLDTSKGLTKKAKEELRIKAPRNAIILAAGVGTRMVPINTQVPKALIEVNGEPLIERIIKQLKEVDVNDIFIVVGFMKEQFEYLIDKYGVELIVNKEYAIKNNLHSLALASDYLSNSYIIPCDIWCNENPFHRYEMYSWYMVADCVDNESNIRVNRKKELVSISKRQKGNIMIGISYLAENKSKIIKQRLKMFDQDFEHTDAFWEETLYENKRMVVYAKVVHANDFIEINTYEQLRSVDGYSNHLNSDIIAIIARALDAKMSDIVEIEVLKKGMTNRSFLFCCKNKRYIMRIPGEGTDQLINRKEEADVYSVICDKNICDDIVYIDPMKGYKITAFLENSRVCDPENQDDLAACMKRLKAFHSMRLKVDHKFDIYKQIEFYETLWDGKPSIYRDYQKTKEHILGLKRYIEEHIEEKVLTHIDAVPDNFLFADAGDIRLIDWEYAGMQDPHVDIAMFCIYALYDRKQVDNLIDTYFEGDCPSCIRLKIYCYIAACGLLWSNWCEYKRSLGVEFGEYSLRQYRYAKDYYKIFMEEGGFDESK